MARRGRHGGGHGRREGASQRHLTGLSHSAHRASQIPRDLAKVARGRLAAHNAGGVVHSKTLSEKVRAKISATHRSTERHG